MKLHFDPPSRAVIAKWMLDECGADYEIVPIDLAKGEHRTPEFLAINPAGKLPAVVDGDARNVVELELGDGPYLFGDWFTVADVMIGSMLVWWRMGGHASGRAKLEAYVDRPLARPRSIRFGASA